MWLIEALLSKFTGKYIFQCGGCFDTQLKTISDIHTTFVQLQYKRKCL